MLPVTPDVDRPATFQARFSDRAWRCARAFGLGEVGFDCCQAGWRTGIRLQLRRIGGRAVAGARPARIRRVVRRCRGSRRVGGARRCRAGCRRPLRCGGGGSSGTRTRRDSGAVGRRFAGGIVGACAVAAMLTLSPAGASERSAADTSVWEPPPPDTPLLLAQDDDDLLLDDDELLLDDDEFGEEEDAPCSGGCERVLPRHGRSAPAGRRTAPVAGRLRISAQARARPMSCATRSRMQGMPNGRNLPGCFFGIRTCRTGFGV